MVKQKLKEQDHRSFLSKTLWKYKSNSLFTDLSIFCSDGLVELHKSMLASLLRLDEEEDVECLIVPEVNVREVEDALELLYLHLDNRPILKLFFPVKSEAIDVESEYHMDDNLADQFEDVNESDEIIDVKCDSFDVNEEMKLEIK